MINGYVQFKITLYDFSDILNKGTITNEKVISIIENIVASGKPAYLVFDEVVEDNGVEGFIKGYIGPFNVFQVINNITVGCWASLTGTEFKIILENTDGTWVSK